MLSGGFALSDNNVTYRAASRAVVQARLQKYGGSNQQRESTFKQRFGEAGCDDQHLSEQHVKGPQLPNVVCFLPGSSEKIIIAGAHFDRVSEGDGVVDNWSGASLLPSLYEAVKVEPRNPLIFLSVLLTKKKVKSVHTSTPGK